MKKLSIFLSVMIVTALCFAELVNISKENQYTSVRKYTKPKPDITPPVIEFLDYKDGDIVSLRTIDIRVRATDDRTPSEKLIIEGTGKITLKTGFNPIVVSAKDEAGNVASTYIIIEKQ